MLAINPFTLLFATATFTINTYAARSDTVTKGETRRPECFVEPYSPPVMDLTFPPFNESEARLYRYRTQRAVNLGSWFVNEKWMTPSLFTCAASPQLAEVDIARGWGSPQSAKALLERHWDSFIIEEDFAYLANIGINTVRLPIGYWHLGPQFCSGTAFADVALVYAIAWSRIVRAINIAAKYHIGVLVDLHGAVGSQNGQDHSGVTGVAGLFSSETNIVKTLSALSFILQQTNQVSNVVGIQVLNEPTYGPTLEAFYGRAVDIMRQISPNLPLYVHNGFDCRRFKSFMDTRQDFIVEDHHSYFVFTSSDASKHASEHTVEIQTSLKEEFSKCFGHSNAIIGEWSCALTPDSLRLEAQPEESRRAFCTAQQALYADTSAGWHFWSYKKEGCQNDPGWCFRAAVNRTLPATFFAYQEYTPANALQHVSIEGLRPQHPLEDTQQHAFQRRQDRFMSISERQDSETVADAYSFGFVTAKSFAKFYASRLGFAKQYVHDYGYGSIPGTPDDKTRYLEMFLRGLHDGEQTIGTLMRGEHC